MTARSYDERISRNERDIAITARDVAALGGEVRTFAPTGAQIAGIQADVDDLARAVHDTGDRITRHTTEVYAAVERLRADMNGRLRRLEVWRGTVDTIRSLARWGVTVAASLSSAVIAGVLVYVFTH